MGEQSVGTIHLLLGLIFIFIDVGFLFVLALSELASIGQTTTYTTTLDSALSSILMYLILWVILPTVGGLEVGRWIQQRKRTVPQILIR